MADWVWRFIGATRYTTASYSTAAADAKTLLEENPEIYGAFYPARGRAPAVAGVAPDDTHWFIVAVRSGTAVADPTGCAVGPLDYDYSLFYGL